VSHTPPAAAELADVSCPSKSQVIQFHISRKNETEASRALIKSESFRKLNFNCFNVKTYRVRKIQFLNIIWIVSGPNPTYVHCIYNHNTGIVSYSVFKSMTKKIFENTLSYPLCFNFLQRCRCTLERRISSWFWIGKPFFITPGYPNLVCWLLHNIKIHKASWYESNICIYVWNKVLPIHRIKTCIGVLHHATFCPGVNHWLATCHMAYLQFMVM
jgi:hypothetical protein